MTAAVKSAGRANLAQRVNMTSALWRCHSFCKGQPALFFNETRHLSFGTGPLLKEASFDPSFVHRHERHTTVG
jgi:hypothetical protein